MKRRCCDMPVLVVAEHDNASLRSATRHAVSAACACGSDVHVLVAGSGAETVAEEAARLQGVKLVLHADAPHFEHALAEAVAAQVLAIAAAYSHIVFPATAAGKNVAPRVAARLDV